MEQTMKLGWLVASVVAMMLLFAGCPTGAEEELPPMGDGEIAIFEDGAFVPAGAGFVPYGELASLATIAGGNIVVPWNPADAGGSIRLNVEWGSPIDISGFTDIVVEWTIVPSAYSANMAIRLDFDDDESLLMFRHAQSSYLFNFAGFRGTDIWHGTFAGTSQRLVGFEIYSDDAANFGAGATLNVSRVAIIGGEAADNDNDNNNDGGGEIAPPPAGTALTIYVNGAAANATVAQDSRSVAGVDANGNLIVRWDNEFRVNVDMDGPADITGMSGFVMDWGIGGESGGFVVTLRFSDGAVSLANWYVPPGRAVFDFVDHFQGWNQEFADVSINQFTGFEIFGNTEGAGTLTVSEISFQ